LFALQGVSKSSWGNWLRTGARNTTTPVPIPQASLSVFKPIPAVGPVSLWTRLMGGYVSYSNALYLQSGVTTGASLMSMYLVDWFLGVGVNFALQTSSGIVDPYDLVSQEPTE
ncbi:MAG: hypothetical protein LBE18_01160, partial [Planctomycetaceae bacterium]|nr:hypothetical protein [Planctomycetaceae bacterium]